MRVILARKWAVAMLRASLSLALVAPTLVASTAEAQSAADKATARTLATDGIKLFRAGKYAEALDKLSRAESLYDAPVHLLYIARSQVKLDKLVEGAETYRKLVRVQLEPGAPPAFKEAIESGKQELEAVEPNVPAVRIEIEPPNVNKLELRIDDEVVPPAAVGTDRPANPGSHTVKAWGAGYAVAEVKIDLKPGENKPVKLKLVPGASPASTTPGEASAPGATGPAGGPAGGAPPGAATGQKAAPGAGREPGKVGFFVGLRSGVAVPGGTICSSPPPTVGICAPQASGSTAQDVPTSDYFGVGGGAELRGGVRFLKYFTGLLYVEYYALNPGSKWNDLSNQLPGDTQVTNTTATQSAGLGVMVGTPRGQLGGYGEIDFAVAHSFRGAQQVTGTIQCKSTETLTGPALRIGGGMNVPIKDFLHIGPVLMFTVSQFTSQDISHDCPGIPRSATNDIDSDLRRGHSLLFFGVGGDFLFGSDKPVE